MPTTYAEPQVYEPLKIEVLPADSDQPVLVRTRGDSEFKPAPGGDLARPARGQNHPSTLPPIQRANHFKSAEPAESLDWKVRQPRSQTNPRVSRRAASGSTSPLIDTARGEFVGSFLSGIVDEFIKRPAERVYEQNIVLDDLGNRAAYDTGRRFADFSREVVNNGWDNLKDAWDNKPEIGLPEIDLPRVTFPEVKPPNFELPDLDLPNFELPDLDLPNFELPDLKRPEFDLPEFDLPKYILPDFKLPDWLLDFPAINLPDIERQQERERQKEEETERRRRKRKYEEAKTPEKKIRKLIEELPDGCYARLTFHRTYFKTFKTDRYGYVNTLASSDWTPGSISINIVESIDTLHSRYFDLSYFAEYEKFLPNQIYIQHILNELDIRIDNQTDPNNILRNDFGTPITISDDYGIQSSSDLNNFAFVDHRIYCDIHTGIELDPPPEADLPPIPKEDDMTCCSCSQMALIFKKTLQSMKYKIKVPIVSCELDEDRWLPKVAYKTIEIFAVDAATATGQAEVYREMAIQARELCFSKNVIESVDKLSKAVGVDEYPASLPASLISEDEGFIGNLIPNPDIEVKNLTQLMGWFIERFDEVVGQFEIPIEIKDSDPTTPGDQPKGLKIPNIAEGIAEIIGLLLQTTINSETLVSLATRTLIETGQDKQQNFKSYMLLEALIEYIGFNYEDKIELLPMTFTPGKENLDEMLKETTIEVAVAEYNEKLNLQADFARYRRAAGILEARYFRKIDTNGDTKLQIMKYLKDAYDLAKKVNKNDDDDFEKFVEEAEIGFTNTPGVSDTQHPYGNSYSERPKIKDLSSNSNSNQ